MTNIDLKIYLFKNDMTQRDLAFSCGVNEGHLSTLIKHGRGSDEVKDRISDYLGIPKRRLFREAA